MTRKDPNTDPEGTETSPAGPEIGYQVSFSLNEIAAYGITESGVANPALTLYCNKDDCNWSEDIDSEFLTDIVLKVLENKHICKEI